MMRHFHIAISCIAFAAAGLSGAHAQERQRRSKTIVQSPVDTIVNFKLRADPVDPADFVKASRPAEDKLQYIPITAAKPEPEKRVLTFEQIKAKEAELEAVRVRHDGLGGRASQKVKLKSVAYEPKKPPAKKVRGNCTITCVINPIPTRD